MKRLIAEFRIKLDSPILVETTATEFLRYEFQIDSADIEVRFLLWNVNVKSQRKGKRAWSYPVEVIEILVSLPESEVPPPADVTPTPGYGSYYEIEKYIEKRIVNYVGIAEKVYRRLIRYFKFTHGMPFLADESDPTNFFLPVWSDENAKEIWKTKDRRWFVNYTPGLRDQEFGIKKFRSANKNKLIAALVNDDEDDIALWREVLSDAQTAILEKNYRRGILEMAIACEIVIKQAFFSTSNISGLAYEYLENQGRIHASPIDLISKVAENTFGENFKLINKKAYTDIDYLFRCRNSIAHRGEISYRDDKGTLFYPDKKTLSKWWVSLESMVEWLNKNRKL